MFYKTLLVIMLDLLCFFTKFYIYNYILKMDILKMSDSENFTKLYFTKKCTLKSC